MIDSWLEVVNATNEELVTALKSDPENFLREKIVAEIKRRAAMKGTDTEPTKPFNPTVDISADAKYLWKNIFIWFWIVPLVLGIIAYIITRA